MRICSHLVKSLVFLAGFAPNVSADSAEEPQTVYGNICVSAVGSYAFGCSSAEYGVISQCLCDTDAYTQSIFACVEAYVPASHKDEASAWIIASCGWNEAQVSRLKEAARSVNGTEPSDATQPVSEPFSISQGTYTAVYNNLDGTYHARWACIAYGASLLGYWGCVLVLKIATNMIQKFGMRVLKLFDNEVIRRIRRHVILAPTFSYRHSTPVYLGNWTLQLPTRQQSLIVLGGFVLNLIFVFVDNVVKEPNIYAKPFILTDFIGMRTGFLTMFLFPLLILFGGRNNFLLWLTGWPLDTFNVFHKWIGRIIVLNLFIHAVVYSVDEALWEDYPAALRENYLVWGIVAFTASCVILLQANHFFRSLSYEIFLVLHILLAVFFIVGAWHHFAYFQQCYQMLYAGIAGWGADRVARWIRILISGAAVPGSIRYHASAEVLEIKIKYSKLWKSYPGCYAFIHVLNGGHFWQSHPFTLIEDPTAPGQLKIFSKVKKGMTRRVANAANKTPGQFMSARFAVEGPYGSHAPIHHYDTAILIAGGIGVTATYAYAADSIKRDINQRIMFIWVVSSEHALEWFQDEIFHLAKHPRVEVMVFISSRSTDSSQSGTQTNSSTASLAEGKNNEKNDVGDAVLNISSIPRTIGRPNMRQIVSDEMLESSGSSAFVVCGPGSLNDDVRISIAENLCRAKGRTDYFEEAFSW